MSREASGCVTSVLISFFGALTLLRLQIWIKSATFDRQHATPEATLATVKLGLSRYPTSAKLHMIHGQLLLAQKVPNTAGAREAFALGVKKCPTAPALWIMSSRLEEQTGVRIKARALLEKARSHNPKNEDVWLESVKVEERDGSGAAKGMLARGALRLPCWSYRMFITNRLSNSSPADPADLGTPPRPLGLVRTPTNA